MEALHVPELAYESRSGGNGYHVTIRRFGTGDVEATAVKMTYEDSFRRPSGARTRKNTDKSQMDEATIRSSRARSARTVRHRCLGLVPDRMITLTYRDNVEDIDKAWADFHAFSRIMRKRYRSRWRYVCVPERQKRGAIHFHLAVAGWFDVQFVRKYWLSVVGEGNVDIAYRKGRMVKDPSRIAAYIAKYLTKADVVDFNKRRYSCSRGIPEPEVLTAWFPYGISIIRELQLYIKQVTPKGVRQIDEFWSYYDVTILRT